MTFEVKTLNPDGSGYMVVTFDDGKSVGQHFRDLPSHSELAAIDALSTVAEQLAANHSKVVRPPDPRVQTLVRRPVVVDPDRTRGV